MCKMRKFFLGMKAPINGIYLSSETIDLLSIIQCENVEELTKFVKDCAQLSASDIDFEKWDMSRLDEIKRDVVEKYKDSFVPMEESSKDRMGVVKAVLEHTGLSKEEVEAGALSFQSGGIDGFKQELLQIHPDDYKVLSEKEHRFISSERDQIKSVTYEELCAINNTLSDYNTVLVGSGRYYDVTKKMYDAQVPGMDKYDFYHVCRDLDFCYKNGMNARYHTLLDKQTLEDHFKGKSKEYILGELKDYVKQSVDFISKYNEEHKVNGKGVISSVDLFNEIVSFDEPYKNMWQELHGILTEEIAETYQYALENKPDGVTYVYNEPFLENPQRRAAVINQLGQISEASLGLIDTIGTQMHIEMTQDKEAVKKCFEDLKRLRGFGIGTQITEFDMCMPERFLFDENGKERSEVEIVGVVNSKLGTDFKDVSDIKELKMREITSAIEETGIQLDGITYWSISDTLDHNLERTNKKTYEQGLPRDIIHTRYAGAYSDFDKAPLISTRRLGKETLEEQNDTFLLDEIKHNQVVQERNNEIQKEH